jgi:hypothetical protein
MGIIMLVADQMNYDPTLSETGLPDQYLPVDNMTRPGQNGQRHITDGAPRPS